MDCCFMVVSLLFRVLLSVSSFSRGKFAIYIGVVATYVRLSQAPRSPAVVGSGLKPGYENRGISEVIWRI